MADGNSYYGQHFSKIQKKMFDQKIYPEFRKINFDPIFRVIPIPAQSTVKYKFKARLRNRTGNRSFGRQ